MARKKNTAPGAKGSGNQQELTSTSKTKPLTIDKRQTAKQTPKVQNDGSSAAPKNKKLASQTQNDRHDSLEPQSHEQDVNDDDDDGDDDEEEDKLSGGEQDGTETPKYPEAFLRECRRTISEATLANASNRVAKLEEELEQLARDEQLRELKPEEEKLRRNHSYLLRLLKARRDELKHLEKLADKGSTTKAPSGPEKTEGKEKPLRKRDTSPAWEHDPDKFWDVREILEDRAKGSQYLVRWDGTDKYGDAWPDSWEKKKDIEEETLKDYLAEKKEQQLLKRRQADRRRREAKKKTEAKSKTTDRSGDDDDGGEDDGDDDY